MGKEKWRNGEMGDFSWIVFLNRELHLGTFALRTLDERLGTFALRTLGYNANT